MSIYEDNIRRLRRINPNLAARVEGQTADASVLIQPTKTKAPTLLVQQNGKTCALHHPTDPLTHCHEFYTSLDGVNEARNILILGCGLGYFPLLLIQKHPALRRLFILEPSLSVFRAALRAVDLTPLMNHPAVTFIVGYEPGRVAESLRPFVTDFMANQLLLIDTPSITSTFPEWTKAVRREIQETLQFGQSGLLVKFKDGPLTLANLIQNLDALASSPGLSAIGPVFKNIPAIIVAAGPSLRKNIRQLKDAQKHFLIIASDTAYIPLRNHGITPHLVATVDPTELNVKHFPNPQYGPESILLIDPEARPEIVAKFPNRIAYTTDKHPFFHWLDRKLGGKGIIPKGNMVSQAGFYVARALGCQPIILVGQDLALDTENGATHFHDAALNRSVQYLEKDQNHVHINIPGETSRTTKEPVYWVEGIDGAPVPTVQNFLIYLRMLEEDIRKTEIPVIDATEGGAKIEGTHIQTLQETIQKERRENVDVPSILRSLQIRLAPLNPSAGAELKQILKTTFQTRVEIAEQGLQMLGKMRNAESPTPLKKIEAQIEHYRTRIFNDPIAEYLIEYSAPKELFEFLKLGPANASQAEQRQILYTRLKALLQATLMASKRLTL